MPELQNLELSKLKESKTNPRQRFDKAGMDELIASIAESGIVTPLLVRTAGNSHFEIVDGARRFRAAQEAKLTTVPVIVRQLADEEAILLQVIANDQRSDCHPMEQATGYNNLREQGHLTVEQLATKVGKSVSYVTKRLTLLTLIEPIRKVFYDNKISGAHALLIARLQPEQQKETMHWLEQGTSAEGLKSAIERHFFLILKDAPFDTEDEKLVPKAGSCVSCPKRTGFNRALFEDIANADTCTDPSCYQNKVAAFIKVQIAANKDAVHLSMGPGEHYTPTSKPKGLVLWVKAGGQSCPDTKLGIVVEKLGAYVTEKQQAKLGQVLKFCTNAKCKTHNPRVVSDYNPSTGGSKKADKARKIELRRRGLVFKELAADKFKVKDDDYRSILDWSVRELSNDHARAVCQAMGWEPINGKFVGKDYHKTIAKRLEDLDAAGVQNWLYLIKLGATDLWYANNCGTPSWKDLEAKAKEADVDLSAIAKLSKEKAAKAKSKSNVKK